MQLAMIGPCHRVAVLIGTPHFVAFLVSRVQVCLHVRVCVPTPGTSIPAAGWGVSRQSKGFCKAPRRSLTAPLVKRFISYAIPLPALYVWPVFNPQPSVW